VGNEEIRVCKVNGLLEDDKDGIWNDPEVRRYSIDLAYDCQVHARGNANGKDSDLGRTTPSRSQAEAVDEVCTPKQWHYPNHSVNSGRDSYQLAYKPPNPSRSWPPLAGPIASPEGVWM